MREHRFSWDKFFPVGLDWGRELRWLAAGLAASVLWALGPLLRMTEAWSAIRRYASIAVGSLGIMPPFNDIMGYGLAGFPILWLCLGALAVWHYVYHRRGSRADYTMRRLPNPWELHLRCLALPVTGIVVTLALARGIYLLYWWMYLTFTPPEALRDVAVMMVETNR